MKASVRPATDWARETLLKMNNGAPIAISDKLIDIAEYLHSKQCYRRHARTTGYEDADCHWHYQNWRDLPPHINAVKPRYLRKAKALLLAVGTESKCYAVIDAIKLGD